MTQIRNNPNSLNIDGQIKELLTDFLLFKLDAALLQQSLTTLFSQVPLSELYGSNEVIEGCPIKGTTETLNLRNKETEPPARRKSSLNQEQLKLFYLLWMTLPGSNLICSNCQQDALTILSEWCKTLSALQSHYPVLIRGLWIPVAAKDNVVAYLRAVQNRTDALGNSQPDNCALILVNRSLNSSAAISLDLTQWADGFLLDALNDYSEIVIKRGILEVNLAPLEAKLFIKNRWATDEALKRRAGILLHPTSLPSNYGIGDLGIGAREFVDFLAGCGQKLWQVLPLNPPGYGNSPYQCLSAFAGNPLLIDIDQLVEKGLLPMQHSDEQPFFPSDRVSFETVSFYKDQLLRQAFMEFQNLLPHPEFETFCYKHRLWLDDYCLFRALKSYHDESPWTEWDPSVSARKSYALAHYRRLLDEDINYHKFLQYLFFRQWMRLKEYANSKGISIIGDLPIYVSHDSSDVWVNPGLFQLDEKGNPLKVAGVPPDAFTRTGQLWGNPIYRWDVMEKNNYQWWKQRVRHLSQMVDIIRIDHFRGFEAYWEVPAGEDTAENGRWVKGPGEKLFEALLEVTKNVEIIAEDLGFITPEVEKLKDKFGFPGMSIMQFEIQDGRFRVPLYKKNTVAYSGTHDNDTILGWFRKNCKENEPGRSAEEICWDHIEMVLASDAETAIIPLQDILCLGSSARMNTPGTTTRNWEWKFSSEQLTEEIQKRLLNLTTQYHRCSLPQ